MPLPIVSPSERSFDPQTVCVWETGLFIARWYDPSIPATKDEVIALAAASGVSDWKIDGLPVDVEGNYRDQVYLVDAPSFGIAALALRQDGVFIPAAFVESRPGDDG